MIDEQKNGRNASHKMNMLCDEETKQCVIIIELFKNVANEVAP
jgi:hypothetical protein